MAGIRAPSAAVLAARGRRDAAKAGSAVKIDWFIEQVSSRITLTMNQRVRLATAFLKDRVVRNISRPVTKGTGSGGGRVVTDRSKRGEFPKADTTQLIKSVFDGVVVRGKVTEGFVGVPLDYGVILETRMDRSFLVRTLNEERLRITKILTGPIR